MQMSPVLAIHICGGTLGLLSGAAAVSLRKGSRPHATAGQIFVFSMCGLGASAMYLAVRKGEMANFFGGILTIYLVTTAWLTARRSKAQSSPWDWAAILVPLGVGVSSLTNGIQRLINPAAFHDGVPPAMNFFMATVVLLAALGDVRMLVRGLSATQRLARASLAHVLRALHCVRVDISCPAAPVSEVFARYGRAGVFRCAAAAVAALLVGPRPF
jgi:hypothetical protein